MAQWGERFFFLQGWRGIFFLRGGCKVDEEQNFLGGGKVDEKRNFLGGKVDEEQIFWGARLTRNRFSFYMARLNKNNFFFLFLFEGGKVDESYLDSPRQRPEDCSLICCCFRGPNDEEHKNISCEHNLKEPPFSKLHQLHLYATYIFFQVLDYCNTKCISRN